MENLKSSIFNIVKNFSSVILPKISVTRYKSEKISSDIALKKDFKITDCITEIVIEDIESLNKDVDIDRLVKLKFGEDIAEFFYKMDQILSEECKIFMIHNLSNLKVERIINDKSYVTADYNILYDRVRLYGKNYDKTFLFHELMHASSSYNNEGPIGYMGFSQVNYDYLVKIGEYLNEGYTQYLTEKYFDHNSESCYKLVVEIAHCIEMIVGPQMEKFYFGADLKGLTDELSKYSSFIEVIGIYNNIDELYKLSSKKNITESEIIRIQILLSEIFAFIIYTYTLKYKGKYSEEEFNEKINLLICSFPGCLIIKGESIEIDLEMYADKFNSLNNSLKQDILNK